MIKEVHIKNFKALNNTAISLNNLTAFTGINGIGKSSFIQALLLLRQSQLYKRLPKKLLLNNEKYVSLGRSQDVFSMHPYGEGNLEISLQTTESGKVSITSDDREGRAWLNVNEDNFEPKDWNTVELEPLFTEEGRFQYLRAERINPESNYKTNEYDVVELRSLGSRGEYTAHFIAKHKDQPVSLPSLVDSLIGNNSLSSQLDIWLSKISKGIRLITDLDESVNSARIYYQFEDGEDLTNRFSPVNVGFGLTYVLPVLVAVLSAKPGDLVIIENPESHLHPSGQSIVGQFLALAAQDGLQIIIETHSDHIIHGIRIAVKEYSKSYLKGIEANNVSIFYFERDNDVHNTHIYTINVDNNGKLYQIIEDRKTASLPKGFNDEWATNMGKLI